MCLRGNSVFVPSRMGRRLSTFPSRACSYSVNFDMPRSSAVSGRVYVFRSMLVSVSSVSIFLRLFVRMISHSVGEAGQR